MKKMEKRDKIVVYSDDSSDSVTEMEPPKKLPPPIIDLTSDDTVSNMGPNSKNSSSSRLEASETNSSRGDNPNHWTDDMIKFYNDDWGGEAQFNIKRIQAKMDKDPSLWDVAPRDLLYSKNRRVRSHVKCWNCCQFGHTLSQCPEEISLPKCYMCGGAGHLEKTCPSAICLTCGNQMALFVLACYKCIPEARSFCSRCYLYGHNFINCSDNWRRFHSTIGKTTVDVPPASAYKPQREIWCSNCAKKGHNQINCVLSKNTSFPDTFPYVASYETRFNRDIYSTKIKEPAASTSASRSRSRDNLQSPDGRNSDFRYGRNLSKSNKKRRNRKKKNYNNNDNNNRNKNNYGNRGYRNFFNMEK